jgi:hypothetical protein
MGYQTPTQNDSTSGLPVEQKSTSNAGWVLDVAVHPGDDSVFSRNWGGPMMKKVSLSADGQLGVAGPCLYYGYIVTTALSAAVCNVRDAVAAGTGDIVDIVAASAAAGIQNRLPGGVYCPTGAFVDFTGTGAATFFYWQ